MRGERLAVLLLAAVLAGAPLGVARAAGESEAQLREAKSLFQEGNSLRKASDYRGALEFYLRSRALVPSMPNTFNAAYCLQQLGRIDEALELYEEVLITFRREVSEAEQQQLSDSITSLRRKLGNLDVSGDVGALLLVDGKLRGTLPVVAPVHVLPGKHTVRVLKEGAEPFETTAAVDAGTTVAIDVKLKPLAAAGRLRVESDNLAGGELILDGAPLGSLPWEGTLAPGPHLILARNGGFGSSPRLAHVVQGQTVTVQVHGVPIGPEVRVVVEPISADMWVDGVPVGKGQWRGTLPLGTHEFEVREVGYVTARERRTITREAIGDVQLVLRVDRSHPRWAALRAPRGVVRLELLGGGALGVTLGSDAANSCGSTPCDRNTLAGGALGGLRGTYTFPSRVHLEWVTGYLWLWQAVKRTVAGSFVDQGTSVATTSKLDDQMRLSGPFLAAGLGYSFPLGEHFDLRAGLDVGAFVFRARDYLSGTVSAGGRTLPLSVTESGAPAYQAIPAILPEVRLAGSYAEYEVGIGLAVAIFPLQGPSYPTGDLRVYGASCGAHPQTADCAPGTTLVNDRAFGPFGLLVPTAFVGRKF
ncbi:MAG TPA: PEGA domain-containing protein [Polyangiaceae bacterium]|jgi:hypothetical protein